MFSFCEDAPNGLWPYLTLKKMKKIAAPASNASSVPARTILIRRPIPEPVSHDQVKNAFAYARAGACSVIEQNNLTPRLLVSEVNRILDTEEIKHKMSVAAKNFARADSAKVIANALLDIALSHEE